jgi:hypothetical protein
MKPDLHEKELKEAVKQTAWAQPSPNFVDSVMQRVKALERAPVYHPLISKKGWWAIAATVALVLVFSYFYRTDLSFSSIVPAEKLQRYNLLSFLDTIHLSKTVVYSLLAAAGVLWVQVSFLASWHKKHL